MNNSPENDPTWDLLGKASKQEASETFLRDTLRSIRLEEQVTTPWWKRLLAPAPIAGTLATAAACVALIFNMQSSTPETTPSSIAQQPTPTEAFDELAKVYFSNDELDSVISPISLVAT